jgi:putative membrane protein
MHDGNWNNGMGNGNWWWIPMIVMMVAFWGGLIWIGITLLNRTHTAQPHSQPAPVATTPPKATADEILAERLARGEIEPDEYRQRLDALRPTPRT